MKICKTDSTVNTNFMSWRREVYRTAHNHDAKNLIHRNDTWLYRDAGFWRELCDLLTAIYNDAKHINVYDYGCSNGAEPYTFIMQMFSKFGKEAEKFMPVIAKDYDKEAIEKAKKGKLMLDDIEVKSINNHTEGKLSEFFILKKDQYLPKTFKDHQTELTVNKKYAEKIKYEVADILDDCKNIKGENTVVFARNFWPYLGIENAKKLIQNLSSTLEKDCFIVTGNFDRTIKNFDLSKEMGKYGFCETFIEDTYFRP